MSSKMIFIDTAQPNLVAALISYYTGYMNIDFSSASAFSADLMSELNLPFNSQANWYCWYTYIDTRADINDAEYRKVLLSLSKVKHLTRQLLEANSNSDQVWCVGDTDPAIELILNTPLEPIDLEIEEQLQERIRITDKVIEEVNQLYAQNLALMVSWKGFFLRLLGINLPCNKPEELAELTAKYKI